MSVPQAWTPPTSDAFDQPVSPEQVIAGLKATDEGGADLVQLLTPEGERVGNPRFDGYVADVDVPALQRLYRDMVLVRRFDREGNALQRQGQLSIWVPLLGQEAAQIGAGRAMRPAGHGLPVLPGARRRLVPRSRPDRAAGHLPRHRPVRLGPEGDQVQQLHDRHRQPGAQRHRLRDGPAVRRRKVGATDARRDEATIVLLRRRRHQPGRRARGHCLRRGLRRAGRLLLPEQPVGHLRADRAAVPGAAVQAVRRATASPASGSTATTCWPASPSPAGRWRSAAPATARCCRGLHLPDGRAHHLRRPHPLPAGRRGGALEAARTRSSGSRRTWSAARLAEQEFFDEVAAEADALAARFRALCMDMPKPPPDRMFAQVYAEAHHQLEAQQREYLPTWPASRTRPCRRRPRDERGHDHPGQGAERRACARRWRTTRRSS